MNLINAEQPHQGSEASQAHVYRQLPDDDIWGYSLLPKLAVLHATVVIKITKLEFHVSFVNYSSSSPTTLH